MSNKQQLQTNNTNLDALIARVNVAKDTAASLPEAGGANLPELTNEGTASDLMLNKELIDSNGEKVTGTFTIDEELNTQDDLIAQIQTLVSQKASPGGGGTVETCSVEISCPSSVRFYYTDENYCAKEVVGGDRVTAIKNSFACVVNNENIMLLIRGTLILASEDTVTYLKLTSDEVAIWEG